MTTFDDRIAEAEKALIEARAAKALATRSGDEWLKKQGITPAAEVLQESHTNLAAKYRTEVFWAQKKLDQLMDAATVTEERHGATIRRVIEYADGSMVFSTRMAGPDDEVLEDIREDGERLQAAYEEVTGV